jgi:hypothetical protein
MEERVRTRPGFSPGPDLEALLSASALPAPGSSDALTPLERDGIPLVRTWKRGAIQFQWRSDEIATGGFLDHHDQH